MKKVVTLLLLLLAGCGSTHSHLGGVFAPALYGTWFDPENAVHKPAECYHRVRSETYSEPFYGSYGTYFGSYLRQEYDNRKECTSVWTVR